MFTDHYEVLEISRNATQETIQRVFRHLAARYHPDNLKTGDAARFNEVMEAFNALRDPTTRAQYDISYSDRLGFRTKLAEEASDAHGVERDTIIQSKLLSLLYVKRRQDIRDPGIGSGELERLLDLPLEHLEFHLWYLKEKGWIARLENGMLAITVLGVDHHAYKEDRTAPMKQLTHGDPLK